jgi:tRNA threonylcarbamoyl adenosine modification protein YeaZ
MAGQYSDPPAGPRGPWLVVDTGSLVVSVVVGDVEGPLAMRVAEPPGSSEALLRWIAEVLAEARADLGDLEAVVGLRGPGGFTGLRVGLATLMGLHQATGVAAGTLDTLDVLAHAARFPEPPAHPTLAVVDALRGEWFTRRYAPGDRGAPLEAPRIRTVAEIAALGPCLVVGFGADRLASACGLGLGWRGREPGPLAPHALSLCPLHPRAWSAASLASPAYLRPPLS